MKHIRFNKTVCLISVIVLISVLCSGCGDKAAAPEPQGKVYFQYFDTVSYVYSYAGDSAERFDNCSADVALILEQYHRLFDIYHEYSGLTNLCTLNRLAGTGPQRVDRELMDFLIYAKELYYLTGGEMNVMLGPVLSIWHDKREAAASDPSSASLPETEALKAAYEHCGIDALILDEENCTVFISDPEASLDVGALGKGYAAEMAARHLREGGYEGYVLNIGGNICIIGTKPDGSSWLTAIRDPFSDNGGFAAELMLSDSCCVTSGIYERYFTVDGQRYHHIIDKDTLYPADYFSSVSIISPDSGLADALSTALFAMSREDGLRLLESFPGTEAMWIDMEGEIYYTPGLEKYIKD